MRNENPTVFSNENIRISMNQSYYPTAYFFEFLVFTSSFYLLNKLIAFLSTCMVTDTHIYIYIYIYIGQCQFDLFTIKWFK